MNSKEYLEASARTLAPNFHIENVPAAELAVLIAKVSEFTELLDMMKKVLFYGKQMPEDFPEIATDPITDLASYSAIDPDFIHGVIGVATEAGEILEIALKSLMLQEAPDPVHLGEEVGDLEWYIALILRYIGTDHGSIWTRNIAKLQARYPDKFTLEAAEVRNLAAEREALTK